MNALFFGNPYLVAVDETATRKSSPEIKLLVNVMLRAIHDYVEGQEHSRDAEEWIMYGRYHDADVPFTFPWVCRHLDYDPGACRAAIVALRGRYGSIQWQKKSSFYAKVEQLYAEARG